MSTNEVKSRQKSNFYYFWVKLHNHSYVAEICLKVPCRDLSLCGSVCANHAQLNGEKPERHKNKDGDKQRKKSTALPTLKYILFNNRNLYNKRPANKNGGDGYVFMYLTFFCYALCKGADNFLCWSFPLRSTALYGLPPFQRFHS